MPTLVVPGVSVETRFDVLPPLPAAAGILGVVGIVDRPPEPNQLIGVTRVAELRELLGPGTVASMPEAVHALSTGAREVVVSAVAGGKAGSIDLQNGQNTNAVRLRARAPGKWADDLAVDVQAVTNAAGATTRVTLRLLLAGREVERFDDLVVDPGKPMDLFNVVNTQSSYVVAVDPNFDGKDPAPGTYALGDEVKDVPVGGGNAATLFEVAAAPGVDDDGIEVIIAGSGSAISVEVLRDGSRQERFEDLTTDPDDARNLSAVLAAESRTIRLVGQSSLAEADRLPKATVSPAAFAGAASPTPDAYIAAIDLLSDDPRIDLILACTERTRDREEVKTIHGALTSHAVAQADAGAPRIAFGAITSGDVKSLDGIRDHAASVRNRRFVLVAPPGAAGVVAGLVARMTPMDSPTFKNVAMLGVPPARFRESELNRLLGPRTNALVVQDRVGRGVVVLKGIDTTGDQISVTRVADQCIRETKAIAENFIGQLNSVEARSALQQQLIATFTRMERAGALVPSTDGTDPAFLVDVYSTQLDFGQGIVRVDIAVRPVRAIDYVYATIRVKN